ncbi:unnamed protein product [Owenia fusiformis]|uniref:Osteoclast-stimulating factor 1 n=1 Tax=Owenia fusiformis TaxID=6347 RepID=A0A8J1XV38_OWEFU|nr:unnamed protein product [Owenia fusiformis]
MSTRPSRPPPPAPVKPGHVKVVRALYPYQAQQSDELSFEEGDTLYIIDMTSSSEWWRASCDGRVGLIPFNYVEENTESVDNPMHEAAKRGNISFMKDCIKNKVSVNGLDKAGNTPLHWAAHGGHIDCMKLLLAAGNIQLDVQNKIGDTALHSCAWKGHASAVQLLLEKGARLDLRNKDKKSAYDLAKDPDTAALLKTVVMPRQFSKDYGGDSDSD